MPQEVLHFDAAINPYGCSPKVVEAMVEFARSKQYRLYGEERAESLREELAVHLGLEPANLLVYNGTGEALVWLFLSHLLLSRGRLLLPYPSYERFALAGRRCAAEVVEVPLDSGDFSLPVDQFIEIGRQKKVAVGLLSSPNNPSGNRLLDSAQLNLLLDSLPECLWIVDEAYADYAGATFARQVRERPNLVVLRTFSKAYGLAGLRVGYAAAHQTVIQGLAQIQIPWAVNSLSLAAAQAALGDQEYLRWVVGQIGADCAQFREGLERLPLIERVYLSQANFFLVKLRSWEAEALKAKLAARGISIRTRPDLPHHVRLTCLTPQENQHLLELMQGL